MAVLRKNVRYFVVDEFVFAYEAVRKVAIILRTSTSLRSVSSNPGVSIKTTWRPSTPKGSPGCTPLVQDSRPSLVARLDPLMRLTNCVKHSRGMSKFQFSKQSAIDPEKTPR